MMRLRAEGRLAMRQALLAALIGIALGVAFSLAELSGDYRDSADAEQREIAQMLALMREPAAQASYQLSKSAAAVVVKSTLTYQPVVEASLRNDFGEVLAEGRNAAVHVEADAWWARWVPPLREYALPLEIAGRPQRVGELRVVAAQGPRIERFLDGVWRNAGLSIVRSLTVALALGGLSYLTLTRPLVAIARRIGSGPAGAHAAPLPEASRPDEIGRIAAAFERYEHEAGERARSLEESSRALAASEVQYRRIVETAGEGVWQFDENGLTTLSNEAMAHMLGTTAALLAGRSIFEFLDATDHTRVRGLLQRRVGSGTERHEFRFRRSDGAELWAEVSACPIANDDGQPAGALAMVTDATERRRRDEVLQATNLQLRRMVHDLERHKADMAQIAELNELLQSARNEEEAFEVIRASGERLFSDVSGGFSIAGTADEMVRVASWGSDTCLPARYTRAVCWAIRRGGAHVQSAGHGVRCEHMPAARAGVTLCQPLYVDGRLIGVLHVLGNEGGHEPDENVKQRADLFGEVIKLGLSNLRLRDGLRDQAVRDPLTGLPNRRLFDEVLPRELVRTQRAGQPLTLAVIDVDHFKHFNDTYGHDAGDRVLCSVAQTLVRHVRASDMACRYGGDEFVCLLPGMTADDARTRFELALASATSADGGDAGLPGDPVTFTVGLATAPACGVEAAVLMRAADAALYDAKARGRSCVVVAVPAGQWEPTPLSAAAAAG